MTDDAAGCVACSGICELRALWHAAEGHVWSECEEASGDQSRD